MTVAVSDVDPGLVERAMRNSGEIRHLEHTIKGLRCIQREQVRELLRAGLSLRQVGDVVGISHEHVRKLRSQ